MLNSTTLVSGQGWATSTWWCREFGLDKDLLHAILLLLELVVNLVEVLNTNSVGDHLERVDPAALDLLEKVLPVKLNWGLTVADEANTALHDGTNVKVVGLERLFSK